MTIFLTYHGIGDVDRKLFPGEDKVWITTGVFLTHLDFIREHGEKYYITFDDGNKSDIEIALPELLKRNLTASFFVVSGRMQDDSFLSPQDIRELDRNGMTIGSHGANHIPWKGLDNEMLRSEIQASKLTIEDVLGHEITAVACPFGSYDRRSLSMIELSGFQKIYTSDRGRAGPSDRIIARNTLTENDTPDTIEMLDDWDLLQSSLLAIKKLIKRTL